MGIKDIVTSKIKKTVKDTIFDSKTIGQKLQKNLGLSKFKYAMIYKIIGISIDVYTIVFDSHFPDIYLGYNKVKKVKSFSLNKIKGLDTFKKFKIFPPVPLADFNTKIPGNAIIILNDLGGEWLRNKRMFENINFIFDKKIEINYNIVSIYKKRGL